MSNKLHWDVWRASMNETYDSRVSQRIQVIAIFDEAEGRCEISDLTAYTFKGVALGTLRECPYDHEFIGNNRTYRVQSSLAWDVCYKVVVAWDKHKFGGGHAAICTYRLD